MGRLRARDLLSTQRSRFISSLKIPFCGRRQEADIAFADAKDTFAQTALSLRSEARNFYYTVILDAQSIWPMSGK